MIMGWAYMVHPDIDGQTQIPDDELVITAFKARGWQRKPLPKELDPEAPNTGKTALPVRLVFQDQDDDKPDTKKTALPLKLTTQDDDTPNTGETALPIPDHPDQDLTAYQIWALKDQEQRDQQKDDQPQPPKKSTIEAAPSGDTHKEGDE